MRKTTWCALVLLTGCHGHDPIRLRRVPVPPEPVGEDQPLTPAVGLNTTANNSIPKTAPEVSLENASTGPPISELILRLNDAYFDLDRYDLRADARQTLESDSSVLHQILAQAGDMAFLVEGHCDERGSAEYNLALGAMRAEQTKEFLVGQGIPSKLLKTISYGKERPQCTDPSEGCWQKNRRAHLEESR